ncbi:MAG TPA: transposase [Chitinophagaceae bacterium]|nr:transposase [Chitinophagaceae bacterium]
MEWKPLLKDDKHKDIIIESLRFLVKEKRVVVYAFVIMSNHIHLIWQIQAAHTKENVQRDFLKFTGQMIKYDLQKNNSALLDLFLVKAKDRQYQFWERNALSIDLFSEAVLMQKIKYIHQNPVKTGLCNIAENYKYSSAKFYETGKDDFSFIEHVQG